MFLTADERKQLHNKARTEGVTIREAFHLFNEMGEKGHRVYGSNPNGLCERPKEMRVIEVVATIQNIVAQKQEKRAHI
jgi:hypothetical protein